MDAASFDKLFQRHVVEPTADVGFEPWGKSLWLQDDDFCAALLRTELRSTWPFSYLLVAGHTFLRRFLDDSPLVKSRNPDEYPVKIRPSESLRDATAFRYEPTVRSQNWPEETMEDGRVDEQLAEIGAALVASLPVLKRTLTPAVMLYGLEELNADTWAERRWIEDYRAHLRDREVP